MKLVDRLRRIEIEERMMVAPGLQAPPPARMTTEEQGVLDDLVAAWNAFNLLPEMHTDDKTEFRHAMHCCQHLVMVRSMRRAIMRG